MQLETAIVLIPYSSRIDRRGDIRMSSGMAEVADAGFHLYQEGKRIGQPASIFIPGENTFGPQYPSTSDLVEARLIQRGVDPSDIVKMSNLNNTEAQLAAVRDHIANPLIINMDFHHKRVGKIAKRMGMKDFDQITAEEIMLEMHPGATKDRLHKLAMGKVKVMGIPKVMIAETMLNVGEDLRRPGRTAIAFARKLMGAEGTTVTDFHYLEPAKRHLKEALKDPIKRARLEQQRSA